jgi:hypothetical protein
MSEQEAEATQKTKPKKGEPVEIPIPAKSQIMRDFEKIATAESNDTDQSPE